MTKWINFADSLTSVQTFLLRVNVSFDFTNFRNTFASKWGCWNIKIKIKINCHAVLFAEDSMDPIVRQSDDICSEKFTRTCTTNASVNVLRPQGLQTIRASYIVLHMGMSSWRNQNVWSVGVKANGWLGMAWHDILCWLYLLKLFLVMPFCMVFNFADFRANWFSFSSFHHFYSGCCFLHTAFFMHTFAIDFVIAVARLRLIPAVRSRKV